GERHIDAARAEADDVRHAVAIDVGKFARELVLADPASGAGPRAELREREGHRPERAAAGRERNIDAAVAETDDVRQAVAVDVGELAREMILAAPTAGAGTELRQSEGERP